MSEDDKNKIKPIINNSEENNKNELNENESKQEEGLLSGEESITQSIELEPMGNDKLIFLSKEEISKMKEKQKKKEEYKKQEKEKINARHKRLYLRTKKRYLKMLEKEKEEENKKYKKNEGNEEEEEEEKDIRKNISKSEKNKLIELKQIKEYYIGKEGPKIKKKKENKPKEMIKDFFVFEWKDTEDTTEEKKNFLPKMVPKIMFGKGVVGGVENNYGMKDYYNFNEEEKKKRLIKIKKRKENESKSASRSRSRSKDKEEKYIENKEDKKEEEVDDKKKDKELIKKEIKKRIQPKLNDGTKKFNWKDFNVIYKY